MAESEIKIAVALILNAQGQMLVVRKRGTSAFMQPGGKIDPGETPVQALRRELHEEISIDLPEAVLDFAGIYSDKAQNESGAIVTAHAFVVFDEPDIRLAAEIEDAHWLDLKADNDIELAELTRNHMMPLARQAVERAGR